MVTREQATVTALNLIGHAADLLKDVGDGPSSQRLRYAAAVIRNDGKYGVPTGMEVPLALMQMALAIIDQGTDETGAGLHLQAAVDAARNAMPLAAGQEVDPDLLRPYLDALPREPNPD